MRAIDRTVLSLVNGAIYLLEGAARPSMGNVARDVVMRYGKVELSRVRPIAKESYELGHGEYDVTLVERHPVPVLVIPPLMVRTYVYDLRPEHSMLRTLRNAGFDVYVVDFGVPDRADEGVRLDDYVLDYVPRAIAATRERAGAADVHLVGYCMGGLFALLHAAAFEDPRVRSIVTIGAPVDFRRMGVISIAARFGVLGVDVIMDRLGNLPGAMSSLGFKMMSGSRAVTKWADLLVNLYDEGYVRSFDAVNTWVNDLIPYPREAFKQLVKDVVGNNRLVRGDLMLGDRRCDLANVRCPLLAFAGVSDNIATPRSTKRILDLVGSRNKTFTSVPGGHVGVVAGSAAPEAVWEPMCSWLAQHGAVTGGQHHALADR